MKSLFSSHDGPGTFKTGPKIVLETSLEASLSQHFMPVTAKPAGLCDVVLNSDCIGLLSFLHPLMLDPK